MRPVGIAIAVAAIVAIAAVVVGVVFLVEDESAGPERGEFSLERIAEGGWEIRCWSSHGQAASRSPRAPSCG